MGRASSRRTEPGRLPLDFLLATDRGRRILRASSLVLSEFKATLLLLPMLCRAELRTDESMREDLNP